MINCQFINRQIHINRNKNLYINNINNVLKLENSTSDLLDHVLTLTTDQQSMFINYTVDRVIAEFCNTNQYYNFNSESRVRLSRIYSDLLSNIKLEQKTLPKITREHENKLKLWLKDTNPFSYRLYKDKEEYLTPVVCEEYSAEMQLEILKIDIHNLGSPILDIGCGKNGYLVKFFREKGFDAFGIDRFDSYEPFISNVNWLEYEYGTDTWETIISNLGFSNHFHHHHLRTDGNYLDYAKKYMQILQSLRVGGTFYYAPDLPFIEHLLDNEIYKVKHEAIGLKHRMTIVSKEK